jgi:hypothetical protein
LLLLWWLCVVVVCGGGQPMNHLMKTAVFFHGYQGVSIRFYSVFI